MTFPDFDAIAGRQTVTEFVEAYGRAEKDLRDGFALVKRGLESLGEGSGLHADRHYVDFGDPDETATMLRRRAWENIVERLQMRRAMSVKAWDEFEKKMKHGECPPITVEIVEGLVRQYKQDLPVMLEASVVEIYNWLRRSDDEYKTNSPYEIGKRVVINNIGCRNFNRWGVNYQYRQELVALENVFDLVAGISPREQTASCSNLQIAISKISLSDKCAGKTNYFSFKVFKKGTLHLGFLNPEHVARLNAIAGGARLKPVAQP